MKSSPPAPKLSAPATLSLALQGGGSHGAFTWGVLDRLLQEEHLTIASVCAVGNGAINAAVMAQGLIDDGREGAQRALRTYWKRLSAAARLSPLQPTLVDKMLGNNNMAFSPAFMMLDTITRVFSPYQFNVFDLNPLRSILEETLHLRALTRKMPFRLWVGATRVRDGKGVLFDGAHLTFDQLLASACQPFLFKTVEVDGEPYWDGAYSGNPPFAPFLDGEARDVLLVPLQPLAVNEVPTRAADILDRVTEISFNSGLIRDMREVAKLQETSPKAAPRLHLVEPGEIVEELGRSSMLNVDWDFLLYLHDAGYQAAQEWLEAHASALGKRSSVDVAARFG